MLSRLRTGLGRGITRNVAALALVSLLTDISSEMLVFLVPLFLANVLAASPSIIGLIEGLAESTAGVLKLASGALSDRIRRRKLLVGIGYGTSVAGKALFLVATAWPIVLLARLGDRFGKGVRTSPRDALIADSTDSAYRGRAFGFHRAMDTFGAFLGVLTAFLVVGAMQSDSTKLDAGTFQTLVVLALVPGVLSVIVIAIAVRDVRRPESGASEPAAGSHAGSPPGSRVSRIGRLRAQISQLPTPFWLFVAANIVFSLGNSSDAFLALRTQSLGVAVRDLLLMIVAFNAVDALVSFPAGALSDRFGRRLPIAIAWLIYAAAYTGFALASSAGWAAGLWILYGAYYGINDAVGRALIADVTPSRLRGTGFGILNAGVSLAVLPASIIAGLLWEGIGPAAPFWFGAACALGAVGVLALVRPAGKIEA